MWNTGDASAAEAVVNSDYVDHANSEIVGPDQLRAAVISSRLQNPDLHVSVDAILGDSDTITVVGRVLNHPEGPGALRDMVWTFRVDDRLAEVWTYRGEINGS